MDILDRQKNRLELSTGLCISNDSEAAVEELEGAFVANKSGPVRGIRSHLGLGSGPAIQRVHFFYEQREDMALHWRVHAVSTRVLELVDYDPAAIGMTYFNNNNLAGVIVDGVTDTVTLGVLQWELITGLHGSLVTIQDIVSTSQSWERCFGAPPPCPEPVNPPISSYYLDDASYSEPLCPGDFAIGTSGQTVAFTPDTDPRTTSFAVAFVNSRYYGPPGWTVANAQQLRAFSENPLVTTVPEPSSALLSFVAVAALGILARDKGASPKTGSAFTDRVGRTNHPAAPSTGPRQASAAQPPPPRIGVPSTPRY